MKRLLLITTASVGMVASMLAQHRQETVLSQGWQFSHDRQTWQTVAVPHDWAIDGPFDKKWDLQKVAIEQNGEKEATEKSGRSGALPWIGRGYYRRTFCVPAAYRHAVLVFDGAMAEPVVKVNGVQAGSWAYGYNTFRIDITPLLREGENLLEVDLENREESSRWYPGAGLYRPVILELTSEGRIDRWATFIRTQSIISSTALLHLSTKAEGRGDCVQAELKDNSGRTVATGQATVDAQGSVDMEMSVADARLWSPESPYLYNMVMTLKDGEQAVDRICQRVGIRTVSVTAEGGFRLNGQTRKIKGVCLHHDLGPLGAAVNKSALIRQVKIMKEMGCDAIRTAHNMPSQMQMEVCDSLGMMVMAESFDMWLYPKCKNGYARFFSEWADRDITNLIVAHRNHPCIVMWSIGNEIPEQWSDEGREIACHLQELCHRLDPTRPVTQGMDRPDDALKSGFAQVMDVPGFNYRVHKYGDNLRQLPQGFLLGSETASTVSSRGIYKFPVQVTDNARFFSYSPDYDAAAIQQTDGQCSGYDVEYCPWSNLPDDDWRWQDDCPQVIGEFVWTGFDYLGEPSPYDEYWPSRSSYFGICDLAGLPKDRYHLYRSHWRHDVHTLHLLPHWSWGSERMGQTTPVYCYTDFPEAELFVNGKSQGRVRKVKEEKGEKVRENVRLDRYRLRWNDVKYEPGELRVVAYDEEGHKAGEKVIRTAGKPGRLQLDVWTQHSRQAQLQADGDDLAFVTVSLTDSLGTLIPTATDRLHFTVEGAGGFRAVCNGDATSLEPFTKPTMRLFAGQLVVIVQAARQAGRVTLRVTDEERNLTAKTVIEVKYVTNQTMSDFSPMLSDL